MPTSLVQPYAPLASDVSQQDVPTFGTSCLNSCGTYFVPATTTACLVGGGGGNFANIASTAIFTSSAATCTTTIISDANFAWLSHTTTGLTGGRSNVFVVDEEVFVEHAEHFRLAIERGEQFRIRTAAEREEAQRAQAETERRAHAAAEERMLARARARELLLCHLTEEQRATFEANKWFIVIGGRTGSSYRIRDSGSTSGNIDVLNRKGVVHHRLCCHCNHTIPYYDQLLAQKLALRYDESRFLQMANVHAA